VTRPQRIPTLAARSLQEEIAELREDIRLLGLALQHANILINAIYCDLHNSNEMRLPQGREKR
jgi:hypothetical protein